MKKASLLLFPLALVLSLAGCKKEKETPAPTKTELLTDKNWIVTAFTVSPALNVNGVAITDIYGQYQACDKDDVVRFEKPNVYKEDEGPTKCSQSAPQTLTGTWVFNTDETIVTITEQGRQPYSGTISELLDGSLKFSYTVVGANGVSYTFVKSHRKG